MIASSRVAPRGSGRARAARRALWLALVALSAAEAVAAQATGVVAGRVVDSASGAPVQGAIVRLRGVDPTITDAGGAFLVRAVPVGTHLLGVEHIAYGEHQQQVVVLAGDEIALEISISSQAIELEPLVVETLTELEERRISSGHSINEVLSDEIADADRQGMNLGQLIQASMPGVLVQQGRGGQTCVTYRLVRTDNNLRDCGGVAVVLDGVPIADPSYLYGSMDLHDIARLEMLSPGQAGVRYGLRAGTGVLLVETKTGASERRRDVSRLLTGFDWSGEERPYPWAKVFGSALLVNAVGVGVGLALADRCFWTPDSASLALRTRCRGLATAGASILSVALPAFGGSYAARWGGQTDRSHGRVVPTMVTAGMALTGGYLLLIGGEGTSQVVGAGVLALGVPLTITLSDRIFRILR